MYLLSIDWDQVIVTTGFTTLITGVIQFAFYQRQKKIDFRDGYRKYILDRRVEAYKRIEDVISKLDITVYVPEINGVVHEVFLVTTNKPNPMYDFLNQVNSIHDNNTWIEDETLRKVKEIARLFSPIYMDWYHSGDNDILLKKGLEMVERIHSLKRELRKMVFEDWKNMHEIQWFLDTKKYGL